MDELAKDRDRAEQPGDSSPRLSGEGDLDERHREAERHDVAAHARDDQAQAADREAATRDQAASDRDIVADANDSLNSRPGDLLSVERVRARRDRQHSAQDRDSAAHDRNRALSNRYMSGSDRSHAADDRSAAERAMSWFREQLDRAEDDAEDMLVIGQAQGQVMLAQDVGAYEALMAVFTRAARDGSELSAAAQSLIGEAHGR